MNKCCIIGGSGFIGSHLVDLLVAEGREVSVIGRNRISSRPLPSSVRYISGDYGDFDFLSTILHGMDCVIDLAYATVPKTSFDDPVHDIIKNLPPAVALFEAAYNSKIKKIVIVSSGGTVYGKAKSIPITEDHSTDPISPYGITKLSIEKYGLMYYHTRNLPIVTVRPANAYGERQRPYVGQGFIATAITQILNNQTITLFGEQGTIRDYVHAEDIARGIIAVLDKGNAGSCYNIGSGTGRSNRDIINMLLPLAGSRSLLPIITVLPERMFDVPVNVLDSSKIASETGWKQLISFEAGIRRTWDHFIANSGS